MGSSRPRHRTEQVSGFKVKWGDIMRSALRMMALAGVLSVGGLVLGSSEAKADEDGHGGYDHGGGYGGVPAYGYYGNGGHDLQPHWHTKRTPFGSFQYFGNGGHDLRPHGDALRGRELQRPTDAELLPAHAVRLPALVRASHRLRGRPRRPRRLKTAGSFCAPSSAISASTGFLMVI